MRLLFLFTIGLLGHVEGMHVAPCHVKRAATSTARGLRNFSGKGQGGNNSSNVSWKLGLGAWLAAYGASQMCWPRSLDYNAPWMPNPVEAPSTTQQSGTAQAKSGDEQSGLRTAQPPSFIRKM